MSKTAETIQDIALHCNLQTSVIREAIAQSDSGCDVSQLPELRRVRAAIEDVDVEISDDLHALLY